MWEDEEDKSEDESVLAKVLKRGGRGIEEKEVEGWGGGKVSWLWVLPRDYNFHFPISEDLEGALRRKTSPRSLKTWSGGIRVSTGPTKEDKHS